MNRHILGSIALVCLIGAPTVGVGSTWAVSRHAALPQRTDAQMLGTAPRTWRVIAGYTQAIPTDNGSNEMVNQFYPRTLTIYQGDKVTWTINAVDQAHTVTFGPDSILRKLEDPNNGTIMQAIKGKKVAVVNPLIPLPSSPGPLVETDTGSAKHLLNCGQLGPIGAPVPQSCTIAFPNVGTYAYDCLYHSGIPGNEDMDGTIKVIPRPQAHDHLWTVWAGTGTATDEQSGFFPPDLTIAVGDRVTWRAGGAHFHTVSFGIDPRKTPLAVPIGQGPHGPILINNPIVMNPSIPKGGLYAGGVASSGVLGLPGVYVNEPGQVFLKGSFTLTFTRPGVYKYYCLVHGPLMMGTIRVVLAG